MILLTWTTPLLAGLYTAGVLLNLVLMVGIILLTFLPDSNNLLFIKKPGKINLPGFFMNNI
jgi:hypothetical protein